VVYVDLPGLTADYYRCRCHVRVFHLLYSWSQILHWFVHERQ